MRRDKLVKAVSCVRRGDTTAQRVILKELSWLVAMFVNKIKSRHGRTLGTPELDLNIRHAIIESAILGQSAPEEWAKINRAVLRDIEIRLMDRLKCVVEFNKRAVHNLGGLRADSPSPIVEPIVITTIRKYRPAMDKYIMLRLWGGVSYRMTARQFGVSASRIMARRKRLVRKLRQRLHNFGINSVSDAYR